MDVSTDLLGTFVAVCQEQSFSKAARKVFRSQAAVSIQIATLEERAGLQFFDRGERPLRLTESGRLFLDFSLEFLNKLAGLDRLLRELASGVSGEVKVAASTSVGTYLLPDLVADILKKSPKLKITMSVQPARQVCESVRSADQDFGIILAHKPPHNLISKPLKKEPGCIIAPAGHPLADKMTVTTRDLRCVAFIAEEKEGHWDSMTNRFLRQHRLSNAAVALRVKDNYQAMKEAVRAGLGVAVLPKFIVNRELYDGTFCELNVESGSLYSTMMLIQRTHHISSPTVAAVKSFLEQNISTGKLKPTAF